MTLAQQIALWADKLRDISALGLGFAQNIYEKDRYQAIQDMAVEMLALATGELPARLEPLRASVLRRATPVSTGDAAIIDDDGRILLIQRADNRLWAMPGGALEVGETAAEGVVREAREEAGVICEPVALVGVFDSRFCGTRTAHHLYQFVFLCRPTGAPPIEQPSHRHEVVDVHWFAQADLPETLDPGHISRIPIAFQVWRGERPAYFDRGETNV
jgi:ADP-ribose pyrophosphatase YjhB (NUDIX family)